MLIGTNSQSRLISMRALLTLILTAVLALGARLSFAVDFSQSIAFDIPAQPLSSALVQFADQAGVQFTAPSTSLDGLRSEGVRGTYVRSRALAMLLRGTGLGYRIVDQGTVAITKPGTAAGASPSSSTPGPSEGKERKSAPSPGFRLAREARGPTRGAASLGASGTEPDGPRPSSDSRHPGLQEVLVTATRREESITSVPVAVSAFSGAELTSRRVETAVDLANYVQIGRASCRVRV